MHRWMTPDCVPPEDLDLPPVSRRPSPRPVTPHRAWMLVALGALLLCARAEGATPEPTPVAAPVAPQITAASAILVDAVTGTVVWDKNAYARRPMASTTKIMTAALILERARLTDMVTISGHSTRTPYANLHAKPGEQIGMQDLLYAIMLRSSNDGCVAAGEHLAGSEAAFVRWMNERARQLGANDTSFVTTNGLYDPYHYSTAADLAQLTRHAIRYPLFNQIVSTSEWRITTRTINRSDTRLSNHNRFMERYAGGDGVKTGYVRQSGKCLVASATRMEGEYPWRLIAVVLNSKDTYGDTAQMMDYGYLNFKPVFFARQGERLDKASVAGGVFGSVPAVAASDLLAVVPRDVAELARTEVRLGRGLQAPLRKDQAVGSVFAYLNGALVGRADLVAGRSIEVAWTAGISRWGGWPLLLLLGITLGPRYARTLAEAARRRRRRLEAGVGVTHREWAGEAEWAGRTGSWS